MLASYSGDDDFDESLLLTGRLRLWNCFDLLVMIVVVDLASILLMA